MFYVIFEVQYVFVTVLHLEYPLMGLILLPEKFCYKTGIWLENVERQNSPQIAKWAREKKKWSIVVWYLTIGL